MGTRKPAARKKAPARKRAAKPAPAPPPVHEIRFALGPDGTGQILLDGVDWSQNMRGIDVSTRGGRPNQVVLVMDGVIMRGDLHAAQVGTRVEGQV